MERSSAFKAVIISCGILTIVCQTIGLFSPAWLLFDININSTGTQISASMGLFTVRGCLYGDDGEVCKSLSIDQLTQTMGQSESNKERGDRFMDNLLTVQLLAIFGSIGSVLALVMILVHIKADDRESIKSSCSLGSFCLWIVSGALLIAAVGCQANQYSEFVTDVNIARSKPDVWNQVQITVHFPWALVLTGLGALLDFVIGIVVLLKHCLTNKEIKEVTGTWNKFTNQPA